MAPISWLPLRGYGGMVLACWPRRLHPETPAGLRLARPRILSKCVAARLRRVPTHRDAIYEGALYDEMTVGGKTIQIQPALGKFCTFVVQKKKVLQLAGVVLDKFRPFPGRLLITPCPLFLLHRRGIKASDGNTDRGPEDGELDERWMGEALGEGK